MSHPFRIAQGDITAQANFLQPAFDVLRDMTPLVQAMYNALNPFGLHFDAMKIERGDGSIADGHLLCSLLHFSTRIRVLVDRVEVLCFDTLRISQQQFVDVARSTLESVKEVIASKQYKSYALTANFHGTVEGTTPRDYLTKIAGTGPAKLGPLLASGAVFYYGPEGDRTGSFLSVDLSGVRVEAVYVRPHAVWDAAKVSLADLPTVAENYLRATFEGIGLDWPVLPPK